MGVFDTPVCGTLLRPLKNSFLGAFSAYLTFDVNSYFLDCLSNAFYSNSKEFLFSHELFDCCS